MTPRSSEEPVDQPDELPVLVGGKAGASGAPEELLLIGRPSASGRVRVRSWSSNNWGAMPVERMRSTGELLEELERAVRRVTILSKQAFREAMSPGGVVLRSQEERIDAASSVDEVNRLGHELGDSIVTAAIDEWARVCRLAGESMKRPGSRLADSAPPTG